MDVPYAREIELGVLGSCLIDTNVMHEVNDLITPDVFHDEGRKFIFEEMTSGANDITILETRLKDKGKLEQIGGWEALADLPRYATGRVEEFCEILNEKKDRRDIYTLLQRAQKLLHEGADNSQIIDEISRLVDNIGSQSAVKHSLTPSEIRERDKNTPKAEKLLFGVSQLDDIIYADGNCKGQVILDLADSGHGKTQFALMKAEHLLRNGYKVQWFQLEGYDSETSDYILSSKVRNHDNIFICDDLIDIEDIKRQASRVNRQEGIDYIVFDYVQEIECNQKISKAEKVEYISSQIRRLAKNLNVVCNPLSQVTIEGLRNGWQQEPRYNDVRWSKQLKQDASVITSVFRPSRIDDLVIDNDLVKDWNGNSVPYNSVFVKQAKVRHGKQTWKRLHLIHTDKGLKPYTPADHPSRPPVQSYFENDKGDEVPF